ncbi:hypothetical protein NKH18_32000 [Streptomyces sp. M10(2022)]
MHELTERLAEQGVQTAPAPTPVRRRCFSWPGRPSRGAATDLDRVQRALVTAFHQALALFDRTGARRLLVVTEDVHVTGHGSERPDPAQAVLGGLTLAVPPESAGAVANWVDLCSSTTPGNGFGPSSPRPRHRRPPEPWPGGADSDWCGPLRRKLRICPVSRTGCPPTAPS